MGQVTFIPFIIILYIGYIHSVYHHSDHPTFASGTCSRLFFHSGFFHFFFSLIQPDFFCFSLVCRRFFINLV